jgi:fructose-1,6-bisphosphatase II
VDSDSTFFAATGVTSGPLLNGIGFFGRSVEAHSVVMRSKSGTIRFIESTYRLDWLDDVHAVK